jgi:hypothetical protein
MPLRRGKRAGSCGLANGAGRWTRLHQGYGGQAYLYSRAGVDHISTRGKNRLGEKTQIVVSLMHNITDSDRAQKKEENRSKAGFDRIKQDERDFVEQRRKRAVECPSF